MRALRINHVAIAARDVEKSARFYEQLLGMERIATYNFAFPVQYLRIGDQQLHLFQRGSEAPVYHHVAFDVDDFVAAYETAVALGIQDREAFYSPVYELPDGAVQMYLRDPSGNLVELNWPDVTTLDVSRIPDLRKIDDDVRQTGEALRATLYHTGRPDSLK